MGCCGQKVTRESIPTKKTIIEGLKAAPRIAKQIANKQFVPKEVFESRMETCKGCPFFVSESTRCSVCTCFLNTKNRLSLEECPEGKWGKYGESEG